jgi:hypothetical protein
MLLLLVVWQNVRPLQKRGPSWSWSFGSWINKYRLLTDFFCLYTYEFWFSLCKIVRSSVILLLLLLPITTKVVRSNLIHGEVYSKQYYVIKFVSDLQQVGGFLRVGFLHQ